MPCCAILLFLFLGPRVAIAALAVFSSYLGRAFHGEFLLPVLGWLFLPWTTLAYAWAMNTSGSVSGLQAIVVVVALLADLGILGGGAAKRRQKRT
ncbi:MAG: hypothetical protein ABIR70_07480 [Bryobacteraceae bacterium]